jgi:hypothetical protein
VKEENYAVRNIIIITPQRMLMWRLNYLRISGEFLCEHGDELSGSVESGNFLIGCKIFSNSKKAIKLSK